MSNPPAPPRAPAPGVPPAAPEPLSLAARRAESRAARRSLVTDLYQAALHYRSLGWSVFAVREKRPRVGASMYSYGERAFARVRGWKPFQSQRPTDAVIKQMFDLAGDRGVDGVAVVTGKVSGSLCVRDFDAVDGYWAWASAHPALAGRLPTACTGRGVHVYFRLPNGHPPVFRKWAAGVGKGELLGDGKHYVVLPPSAHPAGVYYRWALNEPFCLDDLPVLSPHDAGFLESVCEEPAKTTAGRAQEPPQDLPGRPPGTRSNTKTSSVTHSEPGETVPPAATENEAVRRCLPGGPGERRDCLFRLARTLKGLPHLADAGPDELRPVVEAWFALAAPVVRTKDFGASWKDFTDLWAVVRCPMGSGFEEAVRAALDGPFPPEAAAFADSPTKRLAAVCAALQRHAGRGPFFLSCRTAERVACFTNQMTASRRLKEFVKLGLLEVVEAGRPGTTSRKASRYRWLGRAAGDAGGPRGPLPADGAAVAASPSGRR